MIIGFIPAPIARAYVGLVLALGSAAYVSGLITADLCEAYDSRRVVVADQPFLCR